MGYPLWSVAEHRGGLCTNEPTDHFLKQGNMWKYINYFNNYHEVFFKKKKFHPRFAKLLNKFEGIHVKLKQDNIDEWPAGLNVYIIMRRMWNRFEPGKGTWGGSIVHDPHSLKQRPWSRLCSCISSVKKGSVYEIRLLWGDVLETTILTSYDVQ